MKRIVHYYPGAMGNSGVSYALWTWARAQAASGFEVRVLHAPGDAAGSSVPFVSTACCDGLTAAAIPHRGSHRVTMHPASIDRYLGRNDLLVLHEGWVLNNLVAAAAADRARIPYMVMPHGVYEPAWRSYLKPPRLLRRRLERRVLEGAAAVHVFFESEVHDIQALAPRATFFVLPTGFDVPHARWHGGGGYLGWIGRIDPAHKGLDLLVGAIARLAAVDRPLLCIRGYDYKGGIGQLQRLIRNRRLEHRVTVAGPLSGNDKTRFLCDADAYIHPSRWECHSIALLENLALGVPCVVSDAIHVAGTLKQSQAAILSPPTENELASALCSVRQASRDVARRGRDLVATTFNWKLLMPRFQSGLELMGLR